MKKWAWFTLLAILIFAIFIRLLPLTNYAIWGSDSGEYYYITEHLNNEYRMVEDYNGWGFGYPHFPGMFYLSSEVSQLTGLEPLYTLLILIPTLSGFSVVFVFMITKRLGGSDGAGLAAAAFVAVAMPHVFATSHAMPGSLGGLLVLVCFIMLLQSYNNYKCMVLLILCSLALVITHHLSTFILLIALISIIFFRELLKGETSTVERLKLDMAYIFIILNSIVIYWFIVAVPFREDVIMNNFEGIHPAFIIALIYLGFAVLAGIIYTVHKHSKFIHHPKTLSPTRMRIYLISFVVGTLVFLLIVSFVQIPTLELTTDPLIFLYLSPFLILFFFGIFGLNAASCFREGTFLYAWVIAGGLLIFLTIAVNFREIMVYRFTQYVIEPWAIAIGFGLIFAITSIYNRPIKGAKGSKIEDEGTHRSKHVWPTAALVVTILIVSAGVLAYPPTSVMGGFQEGTSDSEMEGVLWCKSSIESDATIATDHRLSSMLFGFAKLNASWDYVKKTFHEENFEDFRWELNDTGLPSGRKYMDYVMISDEIRNGVALKQWEQAKPMSSKANEKFNKEPFYKVYDSGDVQVYMIDWKYDIY